MPVVRAADVPLEGVGGNLYAGLARPSTGADSHDREEVIWVLAGEILLSAAWPAAPGR